MSWSFFILKKYDFYAINRWTLNVCKAVVLFSCFFYTKKDDTISKNKSGVTVPFISMVESIFVKPVNISHCTTRQS